MECRQSGGVWTKIQNAARWKSDVQPGAASTRTESVQVLQSDNSDSR